MRIGIDMLAVQEADRASNEVGRFGRHLVESILGHAAGHQFFLYSHEGLPPAVVPTAAGRGVARKRLDPVPTVGSSRRRPTIQRLLDHNPDDLDWLLLLDPASAHYGGIPPAPPLSGPKLAALVADPAALSAGLGQLALRRADALFALTEAAAGQLRRQWGSASSRVVALNPAAGPGFAPDDDSGEPLSTTAASQMGGIGIFGPFLLHRADPSRPDEALAWVDLFARLPIEVRHRHQLVVVGQPPSALRGADPKLGARARLITLADADEATWQLLVRRCSAWLGPLGGEGSGLPTVEALRSGVPVVQARTASGVEVVGGAGLLLDPADPASAAGELAELLADPLLSRDLRDRAARRGVALGWDTNVATVLAVLRGDQAPAAATASDPLSLATPPAPAPVAPALPRAGLRVDAGHAVRPRIAYFPSPAAATGMGTAMPADSTTDHPLGFDPLAGGWLERYQVDCYVEATAPTPPAALPIEFGGFDVRLFERNDDLLNYHAAVYRIAEPSDGPRLLPRLARRPGLVLLDADPVLDGLAAGVRPAPVDAELTSPVGASAPLLAAEALGLLRDLLRTGSRLVVRSPRHFDLLHDRLGPPTGSVLLVPRDAPAEVPSRAQRLRARARLDLWDDTVVVGQFAGPGALPLGPQGLAAILREVPHLVLVTFGAVEGAARERLVHRARRLGLSDRFLLVPPVERDRLAEVAALLDLAIHREGAVTGIELVDLLRSQVATVALGDDHAEPAPCRLTVAETRADRRTLARLVRDLALDSASRLALAQAGFDYAHGAADPATACRLVRDAIERCAADLPRASGRRPVRPGGLARRPVSTPHLVRPESRPGASAGFGPRAR